MPDPTTPNLGLTLPNVGGDIGLWGPLWNSNGNILDTLGVIPFVNVNANFNAAAGASPEIIIRVTTGAATIIGTLPAPSSCAGKIFTIKKIDAGQGQVTIVGNIDGNSSFVRTMQWAYVRLFSNGTSFDVIGNN
jgi:hypothetical protein